MKKRPGHVKCVSRARSDRLGLAHIMMVALRQSLPASLLSLLLAGCHYFGAGVDRALGPPADAAPAPGGDAGGWTARLINGGPTPRHRRPSHPCRPPPVKGAPTLVGCSDGSREGFADPAAWKHIAGCSGAWSVPGVRGPDGSQPRCARAAGNTGTLASGVVARPPICAPTAGTFAATARTSARTPHRMRERDPSRARRVLRHPGGRLVLRIVCPRPGAAERPARLRQLRPARGGRLPAAQPPAQLRRLPGQPGARSTGPGLVLRRRHQPPAEASLVTKSSSALGGVLCCQDPDGHAIPAIRCTDSLFA
jgi:hypothetical protein